MGSPGAGVDPNTIDPNAVGGGGSSGDPNFDPSASTDMGFGGDPIGLGGSFAGGGADTSGGGRGPDVGAASVANTQLQAPYDIQAGGGLRAPGGGPATDQPQPQRYANASAALMGGPQRVASTGGPPLGGPSNYDPNDPVPQDPSQPSKPYTGPASIFGWNASDATVSEPWARLPNTNLAQPRPGGVNMPVLTPYSEPNTGNVNMPIRTPYQDLNTGGRNMPIPPPPDAQIPTPQPRPAAADAPLPQARPAGAPSIQSVTPQATPPAADPATAATGGQGAPGMGGRGTPQSPLEQLIGQFMQMLGIGGGGGGGMGGVLSPLEHMLARALGINLPQPYPGFNPGFNSPFFQPPGPGQFQAGTTGGRPISPQPGSPPGAPPGPAPGPPGAPGSLPWRPPPERRQEDVTSPLPYAATGGRGMPPWPGDRPSPDIPRPPKDIPFPAHPYERRMGEPGEFNWARTGALGAPGQNLTTVRFNNGQTARVNAAVADRYTGFINELISRGYPVDVSGGGGYAMRQNVNNPRALSMHAYGAALDINPRGNPNKGRTTDMPRDIEQMAWRHGLSWGGRFGDPMHFEPMSPQAWASKRAQMGI